jgi:hypothetical protein
MKQRSLFGIGALLAALLLPGMLTLNVQASGNGSDFNIYILILGIIEDPDPIPAITFQQVTDDEDPLLNAGGALRNDGRPDTAFDPESGLPVVTWAYGSGNDYDIALSAWNGDTWSNMEFLASSAQQELDPRVYIDSFRKTYVIWWSPGDEDKIFMTTRASGDIHWKGQTQVSNDGRRPSVVVHDDVVVIAFERDLAAGGQEVVVASIRDDGSITAESVATTSRTDRLDAVVHSFDGMLWVDWKHADAAFAYSVLEKTGWSDPRTLTWSDRSWIGEEAMRRVIKAEVLSP